MSDADSDPEEQDLEAAVERFLRDADTVYDEYDQGYMNADAALDRLAGSVEVLREAVEE